MSKVKESFMKNRKGIIFIVISSICACVGQLMWKLSIQKGILILLIGFVLYGVGAIFMLVAYKFGSLSVLQPMISLNYVLSIFLAVIILGESITVMRVLGVFVIMVGVVLIGGGDD